MTSLQALMRDHLERHNYSLTLTRALGLRAEIDLRDGRVDAAMAEARRAVELLEPRSPEGAGYLLELGCFQAAYRALAEAHPRAKPRSSPTHQPAWRP
jgi:hypothetical protein